MNNEDCTVDFKQPTTTHLDLRGIAEKATSLFTKQEKEWTKEVADFLEVLMNGLSNEEEPIEDLLKKIVECRDKMCALPQKHVDKNTHFVGRTTAEAYQIGFVEGHHAAIVDCMETLEKLMREEKIPDPTGALKKFCSVTRLVMDDAYRDQTKGKGVTVLFKQEKDEK